MHSSWPRRRAGFTLIELLVVVGVVGLLAGLFAIVAMSGLTTTTERGHVLEIARLASSMEHYNATFGEYPPNMGSVDPNRTREMRFEEHLRKAFPRFVRGCDYDSAKAYINRNYTVKIGNQTQRLNLDYLDQAEALVFWLGGLPTPIDATGQPAAGTKLFGFSNDESNPFKRDARGSRSDRTTPLYDFDETRLVDNDGDGWWEFVPRGRSQSASGRMPPYVYFDAQVYTATKTTEYGATYAGYPAVGYPPASPGSMQLLQEWGLAVPYAVAVRPGDVPIRWINPRTFQIVCAGMDSEYGEPGVAQVRLPIYPGSAAFHGANLAQAQGYDPQENDNLTNFADSRLDNIAVGAGDAETLALVQTAKPATSNTTSSSSSSTSATAAKPSTLLSSGANSSGGGGGGTVEVNTGS